MQPRVRTDVPGIFKRGDRFQVIYRDRFGKQRSRMAPTMGAAKILKAQLEADKSRGIDQPSTMTLSAYASEWIAHFRGRTRNGVAPATLRGYEADLRLYILPALGTLKLGAIEPRDIKRFVRELGVKKSEATTKRALAVLKIMLNEAVEDRLIPSNPARTTVVRSDTGMRVVDPTHTLPAPLGVLKSRQVLELQAILAASGDHRPLILAFYHGGLRIGEVLGLQYRDIDLERGLLHIQRQYTDGRRNRWQLPKGGKPRVIPLSRELADAFRSCEGTHTARVFPYSHTECRQILAEITERAGLEGITPHTFRHSCATHLLQRGANIKQVQIWLGHHDPAFTLRTYVHLLPEDLDGTLFDA